MAENIFPDLKNETLIEAMNAIKANETSETQQAFVKAAVESKYFAPVDVMDSEGKLIEGSGKMEIPQGAKFNFKLIANSKGEQYFPLFTDIAEFQKWSKTEQVRTIVVTFPQMAGLVDKRADVTKGFVINPMSQNLVFPKELLDSMFKFAQEKIAKAKAEQAEKAAEGQKITFMFGKPVNIPDSVIASLKKSLKKFAEVKTAYFVMMKQGVQEHYMFTLDIDADEERSRKIADSFMASAKLFLTKFPIVITALGSELGQNAPKVGEPFYTKED